MNPYRFIPFLALVTVFLSATFGWHVPWTVWLAIPMLITLRGALYGWGPASEKSRPRPAEPQTAVPPASGGHWQG